jgi:hypothetical protein
MRLRSQAAAFKGRGFFIAALFLLPFATGPVSAGEVPAGAQLAPVAKVFGNLLAQVRWPDARQTGKPRLCLLGEDSTIAALRQVDGSSGFVIQPLTPVGADFSACDALYLARDPAGARAEPSISTRGPPGAPGSTWAANSTAKLRTLLKAMLEQPTTSFVFDTVRTDM